MQKSKTNILSTRPLNKQLIDEAARHNIIIDEISFIETKLITDKRSGAAIERYSQQPITAIFTSMNAVDAVVKHLKQPSGWKIYCIGNTTKKLVDGYFGKMAVAATAANADELGDIMIRDKIDKAIFFCGDRRRDDLPEKLKQHDVIIDEVVVYSTRETPVLINKKYNGILFFSPSAVQSFFSINTVDDETELFAIGATTAKAIQQYNKNKVIIAGSPGKEKLVTQVVEYYSGKKFSKIDTL